MFKRRSFPSSNRGLDSPSEIVRRESLEALSRQLQFSAANAEGQAQVDSISELALEKLKALLQASLAQEPWAIPGYYGLLATSPLKLEESHRWYLGQKALQNWVEANLKATMPQLDVKTWLKSYQETELDIIERRRFTILHDGEEEVRAAYVHRDGYTPKDGQYLRFKDEIAKAFANCDRGWAGSLKMLKDRAFGNSRW